MDVSATVICLLPAWPEHRLLEFAPVDWKTTRERDDVLDRASVMTHSIARA